MCCVRVRRSGCGLLHSSFTSFRDGSGGGFFSLRLLFLSLDLSLSRRIGNVFAHAFDAAEKEEPIFRCLIHTDDLLPKPRGVPGEASGKYRRVSVARPFQTDKKPIMKIILILNQQYDGRPSVEIQSNYFALY